jgi:hypothetical protein
MAFDAIQPCPPRFRREEEATSCNLNNSLSYLYLCFSTSLFLYNHREGCEEMMVDCARGRRFAQGQPPVL